MNHSTENVSLFAGFVFDLLASYEDKKANPVVQPLFEMASGVDPADMTALVPIRLYNDMCDWIEKNLGPANLRKAGENVGARAYDAMQAAGVLPEGATPQQALRALKVAADTMIRDPLNRGWEILEMEKDRAVMRRTQTFHPVLQEGLLKSMVLRTGDYLVTVEYRKKVGEGDEFDEFEITWS